MLPKISRYFLVILTIITLAYVLPAVYNTLFDKRVNTPFITYSEMKKEYFIQRSIDGKPVFVDTKNNIYTQQQFMDATPIANFHYHLGKGTLPDSFNNVKLIPQQLQRESNFQWVDPENIYDPEYGLYPLFESEPEFGLSFPPDVFRFNQRIEFIDAKTNKINQEKSALFTEHFKKAGFDFPARLVSGLPTLMKRKDEGWFIVDNSNQLYHLKMVKNKPYVKLIDNPQGIYVKHILCVDQESDEYYAIIISGTNDIYTLNKNDYSTSHFPIEDYNPEEDQMMVIGNLFTKTVTLNGEKGIRVYTMDRSFNKVDEYKEGLPLESEMSAGKIFNYIFPFHLNVNSPNTAFINISPVKPSSYYWIIFNLVLVAITLWITKRDKRSIRFNILDLAIVGLGGLFGFLAIHIIPNRQY